MRLIRTNAITTFIALITVFLAYAISNSVATLVFSIVILTIGYSFSKTINKKSREQAVILFNIVFSFLTLFALFHYIDTVVEYDVFAQNWRDEYKFWLRSQDIANNNSLKEVFTRSFSLKYIKNGGYYFFIGSLGYLANTYFDGNHLFLQFMGSVLWGSLLPIAVYKVFLLYFNERQAFIKVLIFSFCTVLTAYSFKFLRDIIIAFFYTLVFYHVLQKYRLSSLLKLISLMFIVWWIRFEHGLFILIFIFYYVYLRFKKNKFILFSLSVSFLALFIVIFSGYFVDALLRVQGLSESSEESVLDQADALSGYLYRLPMPFQQITTLFYSQIKPFPPWNDLMKSTNVFEGLVGLLPLAYSPFWFVVNYSIVKWYLFKLQFKKLSIELNLLTIVVLLFLTINLVGEINLRRIMVVYPFMYLMYHLLREGISEKTNRTKNLKGVAYTSFEALLVYLALLLVYIILKF